MPMYSYRCPACEAKVEVFQAMGNQIAPECDCGRRMVKDWARMVPAYHDVPFDSVDYELTGEPIVYHTRGQLKEIAKRHGCSVNFGVSHKNQGEHHERLLKE